MKPNKKSGAKFRDYLFNLSFKLKIKSIFCELLISIWANAERRFGFRLESTLERVRQRSAAEEHP